MREREREETDSLLGVCNADADLHLSESLFIRIPVRKLKPAEFKLTEHWNKPEDLLLNPFLLCN